MVQATFEFSPLATPGAHTSHAQHGGASATPGAATHPARNAAKDTDTDTDTADAMDKVGFEIGWDHAHHRITPPLGHLHQPNPVHQGWLAGRNVFAARTLPATAAVRQWLALRLQAWQQGVAFEGVLVNPHFLARIDAADCPVSRQTLTLSAGLPSDACVTRLNPGAAYAAGNLAALSRRVAQACGGAGDNSTGGPDDSPGAPALTDDEQARLDVLRSFATPLPHAQAALLPLRVLPPNRVRVINPVQAVQVMLTLQFLQAGYARRLLGLAVLMPSSDTRQAFQIFMHTLLARRLSAGQAATRDDMRRAMEDSWADPLVNRRWQRLACRLSAAACESLLQRASQRGLVVGGSRWVSPDSATEGWALEGSSLPARPAAAARHHDPAGEASGLLRPTKARNLGSQKLAN